MLNSTEMDSAIKDFHDWRNNREKMCRIPECLWKIAVKLSSLYPISTICENLGLNTIVKNGLIEYVDQL